MGRLNLKQQTGAALTGDVSQADYNEIINALNSIETPQCRH